MVLPLFLMAGGAANEYKAILRSESEARARLNEAQVSADASAKAKRNEKNYGGIDIELPTALSLQGMSKTQKARANVDAYMNWAQLPSNIAMIKNNNPDHNKVLVGDITEGFIQSIFEATEGDTKGKFDTYTKYDYEHLKESWPDLYKELNKFNPYLLPNINLKNGVDMKEAFMKADKAYDIVEGKVRVDKDAKQYIYNVDHEAIFGEDYAKNILTSTMYGGMDEQKYEQFKMNTGTYQYTSLIATLTWRRDNNAMDRAEWGQEIAQIKTFYNITDKEVVQAMAYGMRKKSFENDGNTIKINKFKQMGNDRLKRIADAKVGYDEIKRDIKNIKELLDKGAKTGMMGKMTNVIYGIFAPNGDRNSTTGDIDGQLSWLLDTISEIQTNPDGIFGLDEGEQTIYTIEHGSMKGEKMGALDSATSNNNLVRRLESSVKKWEEIKTQQGRTNYNREEGNPNKPLSNMYYQAQLETLQIFLAYKLALTEQGSGGKAVSDKDFDNALKRVGDTWWINAEQARSRLDVVLHKASRASVNEFIHTNYRETGMSDDIQEYYHNFKDSEEQYVKSLRNYFIMKKDARMTERAERLRTTFSTWGETYGDQVDWNPFNPEPTKEGMGNFWTLNEDLNNQEKAQVTSIEQKIVEFSGMIDAANGNITDDIKRMADGLHSLYANETQSSEDSLMMAMAKMLSNGNVSYEDALTSLSDKWNMSGNESWVSINFLDLVKQGRFNEILGKNWMSSKKIGLPNRFGKKEDGIKSNPSQPSKKRKNEWQESLKESGYKLN